MGLPPPPCVQVRGSNKGNIVTGSSLKKLVQFGSPYPVQVQVLGVTVWRVICKGYIRTFLYIPLATAKC